MTADRDSCNNAKKLEELAEHICMVYSFLRNDNFTTIIASFILNSIDWFQVGLYLLSL